MWFDLWEAITFMLCLAPPIFSKRRTNNCSAELSCFFRSREKKEQNKNETKWLVFFCSLTSLSKTISFFLLLEEGIRFFEHLTLQLYTDGQFPSLHQTPQALDARLHTLLYKRKENKKKNMKIKVIAIDSCTACITFCTEKPSTIFFFFFLLININSEWFEIHSQYNNSPCWVTQTRQERQERTILLWLQLKARRCPTRSNHSSHFKGLRAATVTSTGDRLVNQRVHKNRSRLSANRFSHCHLSSCAIKETSIFIPAASPCFVFFFHFDSTVEIHQ